MHFSKVEGAGNDYVLLELSAGTGGDLGELARRMSDRHRGVGSDGLLVLGPARSPGAAAEMLIYNADGSSARMCGNGLRSVVRWLLESGRASGPEVLVDTPSGLRRGRLDDAGVVHVSMGVPDFTPSALPARLPPGEDGGPPLHPLPSGLHADPDAAFAVSVGNPHLVVRVPDVREVDLGLHGRALSTSSLLHDGANVHMVTLMPDGSLLARTWERGAGPTQACGSGAVAIAAVARALGWAHGQVVEVAMPGGRLAVTFDERGEAWLSGPCRVVFHGEWPGR